MSSHVKTLAIAVTLLAVAGAPAWAQTPQTAPPPPAPGVQTPPPSVPSAPRTVEGSVRSVDPVARTISVSSGWLGFLFSKTLEVGPDTQITVGGKDSSFAAIQPGAKVKASYETRGGRMIASRIEVVSNRELSRVQ
jgi:hypothetical protein